ncbi:hypothetical protein DNTS_023881 [Danionella cerebrum]|uniref:Uncharacterized protein n=1 Tax=Danionella cerebrum TaxID=2873325 RepID=A0A553MUW5_9TELE|nr:hypothetical protein DNTS_023881 [Danionella translucida]
MDLLGAPWSLRSVCSAVLVKRVLIPESGSKSNRQSVETLPFTHITHSQTQSCHKECGRSRTHNRPGTEFTREKPPRAEQVTPDLLRGPMEHVSQPEEDEDDLELKIMHEEEKKKLKEATEEAKKSVCVLGLKVQQVMELHHWSQNRVSDLQKHKAELHTLMELRECELQRSVLEERNNAHTLIESLQRGRQQLLEEQSSKRRLEHTLTEIKVQHEEEQSNLKDHRDQLSLRVRSLKHQLDEAEDEIQRLEREQKIWRTLLIPQILCGSGDDGTALLDPTEDFQRVSGRAAGDLPTCVAQTVLSRNTLGEPLTIHLGFTTGLMMGVFAAGGVSGGHLNPAVSLAMVILGKLKVWKFPVYVFAQMLGAFAGAAAVFGLYYDAFMEFSSGVLSVTGINATGHIFCSYPARHLTVVGTGVLVVCVLAILDAHNIGAPRGLEPVAIGLALLGISVSMGLNCGYPINPARDLGPRLFTAAAGWGLEVFSTGDYWWWIPVAGPLVGGVVGAVIYFLLIELHHPIQSENLQEVPEEEEEEEEEEEDDSSLKDKYEMINMS